MGADEIYFIELLSNYFLYQVNHEATRSDNILDLVITSVPDQVNILLSPHKMWYYHRS
jgi:hypothetical protein